jgi:hypothetical protein
MAHPTKQQPLPAEDKHRHRLIAAGIASNFAQLIERRARPETIRKYAAKWIANA